jgi:hypothetical protein
MYSPWRTVLKGLKAAGLAAAGAGAFVGVAALSNPEFVGSVVVATGPYGVIVGLLVPAGLEALRNYLKHRLPEPK